MGLDRTAMAILIAYENETGDMHVMCDMTCSSTAAAGDGSYNRGKGGMLLSVSRSAEGHISLQCLLYSRHIHAGSHLRCLSSHQSHTY